jgi:AraC-like DNA-binding protein
MERFSTSGIPARDRLAVVNEVVARHIAGRRFRPVAGSELDVEIVAFGLPDRLTVAAAHYSPMIGSRSADLLEDGRDDYLLTLHTQDHEVSVDGGRPVQVAAGEMMLVSDGVRSQCHLPDTIVKVLSLSRRKLRDLAPQVELEAFHHAPVAAPGLALLAGYADLLRAAPPQLAEEQALASSHLYDLVAFLLDRLVRGGAARTVSGIRAARLALVRKDIRARLTDPEFDLAEAARRQGVSSRYIQQLFAGEGTSFSDVLREQRLDLTFRLLGEAAPRGRSISEIAFDAGFSDLSTFNRAFRRRFGLTPSDVRAGAIGKPAR